MNYVFFLTDKCNLNCKYCYEKNEKKEKCENNLDFETIKNFLEKEIEEKRENLSINFFGGEPLLEKTLIQNVVDYLNTKAKKMGISVKYGITTNGILVDESFTKFAKKNDMLVAYSIDGNEKTQNKNRIYINNEGTFKKVKDNAQLVLKYLPNTYAMLVITKNNYMDLAENINFLYQLGFRNFNCQLDYTVNWCDEELIGLKKEYEKISEFYYEKMKNNEDVVLLPFDSKMNLYINEKTCEEHCQLGIKRICIGTDKKLYPCIQFVGIPEYSIGTCETGIDNTKKLALIKQKSAKNVQVCEECDLKTRCLHTCGCANISASGNPNLTTPFICETERMIIEITDKLLKKLYEERNEMLLRKSYKEII